MGRRGFTITEILIAVTLVGIVAGASVGYYATAVQRSRWDAARDVLLTIYTAEQAYFSLDADPDLTDKRFVPGGPGQSNQGVRFWIPGGTRQLGNCAVLTGFAFTNCVDAWRQFRVDDPNASGTTVVYQVVATIGAPATFTAVAKLVPIPVTSGLAVLQAGACMSIDQNRTINTAPAGIGTCASGWSRP